VSSSETRVNIIKNDVEKVDSYSLKILEKKNKERGEEEKIS